MWMFDSLEQANDIASRDEVTIGDKKVPETDRHTELVTNPLLEAAVSVELDPRL